MSVEYQCLNDACLVLAANPIVKQVSKKKLGYPFNTKMSQASLYQYFVLQMKFYRCNETAILFWIPTILHAAHVTQAELLKGLCLIFFKHIENGIKSKPPNNTVVTKFEDFKKLMNKNKGYWFVKLADALKVPEIVEDCKTLIASDDNGYIKMLELMNSLYQEFSKKSINEQYQKLLEKYNHKLARLNKSQKNQTKANNVAPPVATISLPEPSTCISTQQQEEKQQQKQIEVTNISKNEVVTTTTAEPAPESKTETLVPEIIELIETEMVKETSSMNIVTTEPINANESTSNKLYNNTVTSLKMLLHSSTRHKFCQPPIQNISESQSYLQFANLESYDLFNQLTPEYLIPCWNSYVAFAMSFSLNNYQYKHELTDNETRPKRHYHFHQMKIGEHHYISSPSSDIQTARRFDKYTEQHHFDACLQQCYMIAEYDKIMNNSYKKVQNEVLSANILRSEARAIIDSKLLESSISSCIFTSFTLDLVRYADKLFEENIGVTNGALSEAFQHIYDHYIPLIHTDFYDTFVHENEHLEQAAVRYCSEVCHNLSFDIIYGLSQLFHKLRIPQANNIQGEKIHISFLPLVYLLYQCDVRNNPSERKCTPEVVVFNVTYTCVHNCNFPIYIRFPIHTLLTQEEQSVYCGWFEKTSPMVMPKLLPDVHNVEWYGDFDVQDWMWQLDVNIWNNFVRAYNLFPSSNNHLQQRIYEYRTYIEKSVNFFGIENQSISNYIMQEEEKSFQHVPINNTQLQNRVLNYVEHMKKELVNKTPVIPLHVVGLFESQPIVAPVKDEEEIQDQKNYSSFAMCCELTLNIEQKLEMKPDIDPQPITLDPCGLWRSILISLNPLRYNLKYNDEANNWSIDESSLDLFYSDTLKQINASSIVHNFIHYLQKPIVFIKDNESESDNNDTNMQNLSISQELFLPIHGQHLPLQTYLSRFLNDVLNPEEVSLIEIYVRYTDEYNSEENVLYVGNKYKQIKPIKMVHKFTSNTKMSQRQRHILVLQKQLSELRKAKSISEGKLPLVGFSVDLNEFNQDISRTEGKITRLIKAAQTTNSSVLSNSNFNEIRRIRLIVDMDKKTNLILRCSPLVLLPGYEHQVTPLVRKGLIDLDLNIPLVASGGYYNPTTDMTYISVFATAMKHNIAPGYLIQYDSQPWDIEHDESHTTIKTGYYVGHMNLFYRNYTHSFHGIQNQSSMINLLTFQNNTAQFVPISTVNKIMPQRYVDYVDNETERKTIETAKESIDRSFSSICLQIPSNANEIHQTPEISITAAGLFDCIARAPFYQEVFNKTFLSFGKTDHGEAYFDRSDF